MGKVKVIQQNETGRNTRFQDSEKEMTRSQFVKEIKQGHYPDYHIRKINNVPTPVSNPNDKSKDNLG